ncbi:MAG: Lin0512 family protein [Pseudomonadota bacterium]|nr:Lin0512 family protein [Pseudomonadota bacterium]
MEKKRIILEMGMGNDLYGGDYTKAAKRAVQDALHHSSITLFSELDIDHKDMRVKVTIGVAKPEEVDCDAVCETLPRGVAEVTATKGGLDVYDDEKGSHHVVATAAIEAFVPDQTSKWKLSQS